MEVLRDPLHYSALVEAGGEGSKISTQEIQCQAVGTLQREAMSTLPCTLQPTSLSSIAGSHVSCFPVTGDGLNVAKWKQAAACIQHNDLALASQSLSEELVLCAASNAFGVPVVVLVNHESQPLYVLPLEESRQGASRESSRSDSPAANRWVEALAVACVDLAEGGKALEDGELVASRFVWQAVVLSR